MQFSKSFSCARAIATIAARTRTCRKGVGYKHTKSSDVSRPGTFSRFSLFNIYYDQLLFSNKTSFHWSFKSQFRYTSLHMYHCPRSITCLDVLKSTFKGQFELVLTFPNFHSSIHYMSYQKSKLFKLSLGGW